MPQAGTKKFPVKEAYDFAESHGLAQESRQIRSMETNWSKAHIYTTSIRGGYFIELFQQNGLLDQFKHQCWQRGFGKEGDTECRRCLKVKADFDKEMGGARLSFTSQKAGTNRIETPSKDEELATKSRTESRLVENSSTNRTANTTLIEDLDEIEHRNIGATTKSVLSNARIGQGQFRTDVFSRWGNRCAVTASTTREAIRASHILPWRDSTDEQRLDPNNGLPLIASLDALFDIGLISFDSSGRLLVSPNLAEPERRIFGLGKQALLKKPSEKTATYLAGHCQKHGFQK